MCRAAAAADKRTSCSGSLFNHSHSSPNVSYTLDRTAKAIRYVLMQDVAPGQELLISYGTGKMWWEAGERSGEDEGDESDERVEDELLMLAQMGLDHDDKENRQQKRREERRRFANAHPHAPHLSSRLPLTPTPPSSTPPLIRSPVSVGPAAAPLWRITAAVDPNTTPLDLMLVWAVEIDPRKSANFMQFSRSIARRLRAAEGGGDGEEHIRREQDTQVGDDDDEDTESSEANSGDEDESMKHLRLFHRVPDRDHLCALVCRVQDVPSMDKVVALLRSADVVLEGTEPKPFQVQVPKFSAPSRDRLPEWKAYWPVAVKHGKLLDILTKSSLSGNPAMNQGSPTPGAVDRAADTRLWTKDATQWAIENFKRCLALARRAREQGQVAIGVFVTPTFSDADSANAMGPDGHIWIEVEAWDTRRSERNPIKHGVTNAIRDVAKVRSERDRERLAVLGAKVAALHRDPLADPNANREVARPAGDSSTAAAEAALAAAGDSRTSNNGQDYLLNNLTLFTTHEPCVSCCMALVHSRVRAVFFIKPSPGAGGCCGSGLREELRCSHAQDGGPYAVQEQAGLNHHFDVWRWVGDEHQLSDYDLDQLLDIEGMDA